MHRQIDIQRIRGIIKDCYIVKCMQKCDTPEMKGILLHLVKESLEDPRVMCV